MSASGEGKSIANLTDWAWVQMMLVQALRGTLTPDVLAVALSEEDSEWILTFFLKRPVSEAKERNLIEVAGDAEAYLEQEPAEQIQTTKAILKPIRSTFIADASSQSIYAAEQVGKTRLIFSWDWPV